MKKTKQVEEIAKLIQDWVSTTEIKQFSKMYHPTNDSISIPLFIDGEKIVVEIKTLNFPAEF
jgi:hypothetical protein